MGQKPINKVICLALFENNTIQACRPEARILFPKQTIRDLFHNFLSTDKTDSVLGLKLSLFWHCYQHTVPTCHRFDENFFLLESLQVCQPPPSEPTVHSSADKIYEEIASCNLNLVSLVEPIEDNNHVSGEVIYFTSLKVFY